MNINTAFLVREIKKGCTYRRLAEIYYPKDHPGYGNQGWGEELCREALKVIYPNDDVWMMDYPEQKFGVKWEKENKSYIGNFYWWE